MREIKFRAWADTYMENSDSLMGLSNFFEYCEDRNWPVMQYTGLKDKNRKEIWEGDIVEMKSYNYQHMNNLKWQVVYVPEAMCFKFYCQPKKNGEAYEEVTGWHSFEVLGNIYENPELINQ